MKKRSTISWVLEFAGRKKSFYVGSVLAAILGAAVSFVPYLIIADVVGQLIDGNRRPGYYIGAFLLMALCWIVRVTLHSVSTTLSHVATFSVLGGGSGPSCAKNSLQSRWDLF